MTKQEFISLLSEKLIASGMDASIAAEKCEKISQNFNKLEKADAEKYFTEANVDMVAAKIIGDVSKKAENKDRPTMVIPKSNDEISKRARTDNGSTVKKKNVVVVNDRSKIHSTSSRKNARGKSDDDGRHPRLLLWLLALLCAPSIILVIALIIGSTLAIAVAMAGLIIALVTIIAAVVCGGSVLSVASLIYGITQIISEPRYVGLHEIGLAMIFAGGTIAICIVLYNIAVRLIPFLYKLIGKGLVLCRKKIKVWAVAAWKGCENL